MAITGWLAVVCALIFTMVVVGGITRLTESGLSITEWKPIAGALPPLSSADWQSEFSKYQQIPEYQEINGPAGMTLADFKAIYFWEWSHRLLGRLIGLAFALPLAWFWLRKQIPPGYKPRLLLLLALGGMQGVIGWWMVVSGLSVRTDVSHFRLATHLIAALIILGWMFWTMLDLIRYHRNSAPPSRMTVFGVAVLVILLIQLLFGAFTAGLNAGRMSNTWPMMNGRLLPVGIDWSVGWIKAVCNNPYLIHFIHRWWAWAVVTILIILSRKIRKSHRKVSLVIHTAFGIQIVLGIATVMSGMNLTLAALHQAVGALVVLASVWGIHILGQRER